MAEATTRSNGMQPADRDPLDQLVDAARQVLESIERRAERHDAEVEKHKAEGTKRRDQAKRIRKAIAVLTEAPTRAAPEEKRAYTSPKCPQCGFHPASKEHRNRCLAARATKEVPE